MGEEEIKLELFERLEEPYRPPLPLQIALEAVVIIIALALSIHFQLGIDESTLAVFLSASLFYPIFIKVRDEVSESIGIGLAVASIAAVIAYVLTRINVMAGEAGLLGLTPNMGMLIIFAEILAIELIQHVSWRLKVMKNIYSYIIYGALTAFFLLASLSVLYAFTEDMNISIGISLVLSALFFYAILPERPF